MFCRPMNGLGAIVDSAAAPSFMQNLLTAYGQLEAIKTQRELSKINLQRLQAGQQAISYDQIPGAVPTIAVQADIAPGTKNSLQMAALALAGVATIYMITRRR